MVNPTDLLENDNRLHTQILWAFYAYPQRLIPRNTPRGGAVNVSMIMSNYIHTWFIWLAGQ